MPPPAPRPLPSPTPRSPICHVARHHYRTQIAAATEPSKSGVAAIIALKSSLPSPPMIRRHDPSHCPHLPRPVCRPGLEPLGFSIHRTHDRSTRPRTPPQLSRRHLGSPSYAASTSSPSTIHGSRPPTTSSSWRPPDPLVSICGIPSPYDLHGLPRHGGLRRGCGPYDLHRVPLCGNQPSLIHSRWSSARSASTRWSTARLWCGHNPNSDKETRRVIGRICYFFAERA